MKIKKVFSLLLAGLLTVSLGTSAYATDMDAEIAQAQIQKQEAEAALAQTQSNISDLESKKQEMENYLTELNTQYEELTNSVAQLSVEAAEKEEELKQLQSELEEARQTAKDQYEAMKIRIAYIYEKGGTCMLEMLLSSQSIAEFLNRAENVVRISEYDRGMLKKYEELSQSIQEKESAAEAEAAQIDTLMSERSAKQQEVQSMAASTRDSIVSYANQLSSSQEEANALMSQINSADNSIANLMQQAEAQAAAEAEAQAAQQAEEAQTEESADEVQETGEEDYSQDIEDYGYNPEEDTTESYSVSTSSDVIVEEEDDESSEAWWNEEGNSEDYSAGASGEYEEEEESSSDSGQGTYLGNFTLTAYCNCAQCCGTAGNLTASGTVPTAGRTVAMAGVPFGTQLLINGNVYTVEDLGTPYGHVDIYCDSHETALGFGLQSADVYQLN